VLLNFIAKADVKLHARHNSPFGIGKYVNSSCGRFNPGTEIYVEFWFGDIWVPYLICMWWWRGIFCTYQKWNFWLPL